MSEQNQMPVVKAQTFYFVTGYSKDGTVARVLSTAEEPQFLRPQYPTAWEGFYF